MPEHASLYAGGNYCKECHKAWPCPDVSGVADLRRSLVFLADAITTLANGDPHPSVTTAVRRRCAEALKALQQSDGLPVDGTMES